MVLKSKSKSKAVAPECQGTTPAKKQTSKEVLAYVPSAKEIENGKKVLAILEKMEDIGFTVHRSDLFTVEEPEFGLTITIDAEEEVICLLADVCNVAHLEKNIKNWQEELLILNNGLLYGAFSLYQGKVLLRANLAAQNLDSNELEDALSAMFAGIIRNAHFLKLL